MGELVNHLKRRVIVQAIIIWLLCLVFTMGVEDNGFVFAFYAVASVLFLSGVSSTFAGVRFLRRLICGHSASPRLHSFLWRC